MRLTDTCQVLHPSGATVGGSRRCEFGHTGGDTPTLAGHSRYVETARVIVEPDPQLAGLANVSGWKVVHKAKTYDVTAVLPRYRPGGRLHHVSLDLQAVAG